MFWIYFQGIRGNICQKGHFPASPSKTAKKAYFHVLHCGMKGGVYEEAENQTIF
jgi:hypothetical protein